MGVDGGREWGWVVGVSGGGWWVVGGGWWAVGGGADGRALLITSGILYSVMRAEGSILAEATLSQFP